METSQRPTTRMISNRPSIPRSRCPVRGAREKHRPCSRAHGGKQGVCRRSRSSGTPFRSRCTIGRCGVMTTKEAFDIVLALAFDNMVDEKEMPEMYNQQSEALEIIAEIAKYYGSRRK